LQIGCRRLLGVAAALVATTGISVVGLHNALAGADDRVPMGGGAGIIVNGDTLCTLTTIGTDPKGELIGFTSAHCGGPGAQVAAEAAKGRGVLGTMVSGNDKLDYAVIQFDPASGQILPSARSLASRAAPPATRAASRGARVRTRAPSSCRCADNRATPAARSPSTINWSG